MVVRTHACCWGTLPENSFSCHPRACTAGADCMLFCWQLFLLEVKAELENVQSVKLPKGTTYTLTVSILQLHRHAHMLQAPPGRDS